MYGLTGAPGPSTLQPLLPQQAHPAYARPCMGITPAKPIADHTWSVHLLQVESSESAGGRFGDRRGRGDRGGRGGRGGFRGGRGGSSGGGFGGDRPAYGGRGGGRGANINVEDTSAFPSLA